MKGGTAINLFVQDMPRLSVDIDVVFTDHTLARDDSLQAIQSDLKDAWQVDCSPGSCMHGADYRLALKTPGDLQGVENAVLAPGFVKTEDGSTRLS